ncbi:MAG: M23 family metallopeptidase [Nanoarchaeota archaeon]
MNKTFGRNREYGQRLEGKLPKELERLRHSIEWPINPNTADFHLAHYYKEKERTQEGLFVQYHGGIDIQTPAGTPVYAPENGRIIGLEQDEARDLHLADLTLYSPDSGIGYMFAHVRFFELPEKIRNANPEDIYSGIPVEKGEQIAEVGYWPWELSNYDFLPDEIRKQEGYFCHLHLETGFWPYNAEITRDVDERFNPLLILKKLK